MKALPPPPGYTRIVELGKKIGRNQLHRQLAAGERAAVAWDYWNGRILPVVKQQWLQIGAEKIIKTGKLCPIRVHIRSI